MVTSSLPPTPHTAVLPRVLLRSQVLQEGLNADEVQRRLKTKKWIALRPGAYVEQKVMSGLGPVQRHLMLIKATMAMVDDELVVSHASAACLLGIDLWQPNLRAVQVTRPGSSSGHRRQTIHSLRAPMDRSEIVMVDGLRVTCPARTVIDLARLTPFENAVVAADAALRAGLTDLGELNAALSRAPRRPGIRKAHEVISFADAKSESVAESRSRVLFRQHGLPAPESQFAVRDSTGAVFARADFGWEAMRTIGEFDGAQKYGRLLRDGEPAGDRIYQEKLREDRIRDEGYQVVRWTWDELQRPLEIAARLQRAFDRGRM